MGLLNNKPGPQGKILYLFLPDESGDPAGVHLCLMPLWTRRRSDHPPDQSPLSVFAWPEGLSSQLQQNSLFHWKAKSLFWTWSIFSGSRWTEPSVVVEIESVLSLSCVNVNKHHMHFLSIRVPFLPLGSLSDKTRFLNKYITQHNIVLASGSLFQHLGPWVTFQTLIFAIGVSTKP